MSANLRVEPGGGGANPQSSSSPPPPGFSGTSSSPLPPQLLFSDSGAPIGNHGNSSEGVDGDNSSSFSNLAAALGSGLVESMEDATRGDHQGTSSNTKAAVGTALLSDSFFNPTNDLTYERHKRHAASRLLGAGHGGSSSHKTAEAGSLFGGAFNSGSLMGGAVSGTNGGSAGVSSLQAAAAESFPHDPNAPPFRPSSKPSYHDRASNGRNDHRSRLPVTKDLGLTVMEPVESPYHGRPGQATSPGLPDWKNTSDDGTYGIQRDMQNLWSSDGVPGIGPRNSSRSPIRSNDIFDSGDLEPSEALRPFTWDINHHEPSRTLVVLGAATVNPNDIRNICESFGVVESFRSDFVDRGIVFVSFFDMRCAQFAALQLPPRLQRMGPGVDRIQVKFCVPLNSSSQNDESLVVINDLPAHINVDMLAQMLSSFGAIRSLKNLGGSYGKSSFVVEYHDIQDAKQVVLELESTQPWGPDVSIEVGNRNPADRKKGRELLALIGRWRGQPAGPGSVGSAPRSRGRSPVGAGGVGRDGMYGAMGDPMAPPRYERGMPSNQHSSQLILGPDGRYTYGSSSYDMPPQGGYPPYGAMGHRNDLIAHGHQTSYAPHHHQPPVPHQQQHYYAPSQRGGHYQGGGTTVVSGGSHHSGHRSAPGYFGDDRSIGSHRSAPTHIGSLAGSTSDGQNQHLVLDLDAVENGLDSRTSLMVRNIPNKYTQQMLLSEFSENGHGPGVIDFFYLPIDFKNRCNRGYAFINFVDNKDILMFHRQYYGKHWRTFNSDKICDITYARIQGKAAMLKRFENSALMEKDEEYKPLVFVSNGPDKGKRLPFPDPNKTS